MVDLLVASPVAISTHRLRAASAMRSIPFGGRCCCCISAVNLASLSCGDNDGVGGTAETVCVTVEGGTVGAGEADTVGAAVGFAVGDAGGSSWCDRDNHKTSPVTPAATTLHAAITATMPHTDRHGWELWLV